MNILQIGELYNYGGATEIMEHLQDCLKEKGHNVILIFGYNPHKQKIRENHFVIFDNPIIRKVNYKIRPLLEKYDFPNIYARLYIEHYIKKYRIEIVHMHAMQGGFLSICDIKYFCEKYNVVWTIHDTWTITGGCMCYWDCRKWMTSNCRNCSNTSTLMEYANPEINLKRKESALRDKNVIFTTPSIYMKENFGESYLKGEQIEVIANGINIKNFKILNNIEQLKEKYGISKDKRILMFLAGSLKDPYKGWKYLKQSLCEIKNPQQYEIIVVGGEAEDFEDINIPIVKMGYIRKKEILNEIYNVADIFLVPSVQDNFPTVILEAQASGTPVIAFGIGGIPEQITSDTGWIVSEISSHAFANTINSIFSASDSDELIQMKGSLARKRCEKLYDEKVMTTKYINIYQKRLYKKSKRDKE